MVVLSVLRIAIVMVLLALGMNARPGDLTYLWKRPGLLMRSLVAMYVLVPVVAVLMVRTLEIPRGTEIALLVLAICAGAPLLPRKLIKLGGDPDYIFSLVVTTSVLAVLSVPLSLEVMARYMSLDRAVDPTAIAGVISKTFLVPFAAGMAIRFLFPTFADRMDDRLLKAGSVALALSSLIIVATRYDLILALGWRSFVAFGAFSLAALLIGHILGGPEPRGRTSLAVSCSRRHVGLALLVAADARSDTALTIVAGYLLASTLVAIPYIAWRRSVHGQGDNAGKVRTAA